jgi:SAM-dependent methyltransferase
VEIGCGSAGGLVARLRTDGYHAIGIDPRAPDGPQFQQIEIERAELPPRVDAVVASTSLHHVADPAHVLDLIGRALSNGGTLVVVEWAWERFDESTASWCFQRLGRDEGWLHRRRDEWLASGEGWSSSLRAWAEREGVHSSQMLLRLLNERFEGRHLAYGPYFFADLADTSEADEQAAIDSHEVRATRIDWAGDVPTFGGRARGARR